MIATAELEPVLVAGLADTALTGLVVLLELVSGVIADAAFDPVLIAVELGELFETLATEEGAVLTVPDLIGDSKGPEEAALFPVSFEAAVEFNLVATIHSQDFDCEIWAAACNDDETAALIRSQPH